MRFFQKTFILANTDMEMVFPIYFLIFSNIDIQFTKKKLIWRTYTIKEVLQKTCKVKFIGKNNFVEALLEENVKAFMAHINNLMAKITIHLKKKI